MSPLNLHLGNYKPFLSQDGVTYNLNINNDKHQYHPLKKTEKMEIYQPTHDGKSWAKIRISQLCRISSYEADYSFILEFFWFHNSRKHDDELCNL